MQDVISVGLSSSVFRLFLVCLRFILHLFACRFMKLLSYLEPSVETSTAETKENEIIWPVAVPKLRDIFYYYVVCHVLACSEKISRAPLFERGGLDINCTPVSVYWLNKALQRIILLWTKCGEHSPLPTGILCFIKLTHSYRIPLGQRDIHFRPRKHSFLCT